MINKNPLVNAAIGGLLLALVSGVANAIPIIDIVDPAEDVEVDSTNPEYIFTHDITDGIEPDMFDPGRDIIDSATIAINLTDDGGSERIEITIDEMLTTTINNIGSSRSYSAVIPSITDLQLDGMLDIMLTTRSRPSGIGNFFFASSILTAQVTKRDLGRITPDQHQVPEPATLTLMGLGLAGLGFARRKTKA
jgi:hypothetical protein